MGSRTTPRISCIRALLAEREKQYNGEESTSRPNRPTTLTLNTPSRLSSSDGDSHRKIRPDGKLELTEDEAYKGTVLTVNFVVRTSMNFNSGTYSNAVSGLTGEFNINAQAARVGQRSFFAFVSKLSLQRLAPNFGTLVVSRFLSVINLAGGTVTLGMSFVLAFAVAYTVLPSVGGTTIGPFFCGMTEHPGKTPTSKAPTSWSHRDRTSKSFLAVWRRPFGMFLCEPIALSLPLHSVFSDTLIFTSIESFALAFEQWGLDPLRIGLCLATIFIGYLMAYAILKIWRQHEICKKHGLFGFAWITMGPEYNHWIAPLMFIYMVASCGPYSASARDGNGFARVFLAGLSAITILDVLAVLVTIYVFYWKGPQVRENSEFAQTLAADRARHESRRLII
ncbi:hypothetical protein BDW66DRAFT_157830 [Aspergillus desertorum]